MKSTTLDYRDSAVRLKGVSSQDERRTGGRPARRFCFRTPAVSAIMPSTVPVRSACPRLCDARGRPRRRRYAGTRRGAGHGADERPALGRRSLASAGAGGARRAGRPARRRSLEARPAIGYCFGGSTALELARSGAPLAADVQLSRWSGRARARTTHATSRPRR